MNELIILLGMGESGKTSYAKTLEKDGYEIISFDDLKPYGSEINFQKALEKIIIILNTNNSEHDYVLDGYVYPLNGKYPGAWFNYIKNHLKNHKIKPVVIFTDADTISKRVQKRGSPDNVTKKFVVNIYRDIGKYWDLENAKFIHCVDNECKEISTYEEVMKIVTNIKIHEVINLLTKLYKMNYAQNVYDRYYQTIDLPFNMRISGYNADYEHKTWERIKDLTDYKGKTVADIGCLNGYFCFNIKELDAERVVGYDRAEGAVEIGRDIAYLKALDVEFKVLDVDYNDIPEKFDIILVLNMAHHLKDTVEFFKDVFRKSKEVITEIELEKHNPKFTVLSADELYDIAKEFNHKLITIKSSARPHRVILHFERDENV